MFELLTPVGSATNISVQWSDSEFVGLAPMAVKAARQVGLTPIVSLSITKGRSFVLSLSLSRSLALSWMGFTPDPFFPVGHFSESEAGTQEIQVPKTLQHVVQGKASFSHKVLSENYVETACLIAQAKPAYFCLAADINLLAIGRADEFQRFLAAYKIAYREAKKISPETKFFVSFQYEIFKQIKAEHLSIMADLKPEVLLTPPPPFSPSCLHKPSSSFFDSWMLLG